MTRQMCQTVYQKTTCLVLSLTWSLTAGAAQAPSYKASVLKGLRDFVEQPAATAVMAWDNTDFSKLHMEGWFLEGHNFQGSWFVNSFLKEAKLAGADFRGANLQGAILLGADLRGANFQGADLRGADLGGVNWDNTDFTGALLEGAYVAEDQPPNPTIDPTVLAQNRQNPFRSERCFYTPHTPAFFEQIATAWGLARCQFPPNTNFSLVGLENVNFYEASLPGAFLVQAHLTGANFTNAKLSGASFGYANLRNATFTNADLRGADFIAAHLEGADFNGAQLEGAIFSVVPGQTLPLSPAQLTQVTLYHAPQHCLYLPGGTLFLKHGQTSNLGYRKCRFPRGSIFASLRLDMNHFDFSEAVMVAAHFGNVSLDGANLQKANLTGASFTEVTFVETNLKDAFLTGATFANAYFKKAHLENAYLENATVIKDTFFPEAQAQGADFTNATLTGVVFAGAQLQGARFPRANLKGATFEGAHLQEANLRGEPPLMMPF